MEVYIEARRKGLFNGTTYGPNPSTPQLVSLHVRPVCKTECRRKHTWLKTLDNPDQD